MSLGKTAQQFLLYGYFGFDIGELKDDNSIKEKCAHRAYLDLNRTLSYNDGDGKRKEFTEEVEKEIIGAINKYDVKTDFDDWHNRVCKDIMDKAKSKKLLNKDLNYGQAQKWLNMTLKYLWMLGILNKNIDENKLHVPIDNFIFQAIYEGVAIKCTNNLKDNIKKIKENENYRFVGNGKNECPWSKLSDADYKLIQDELRNSVDIPPIEWESKAWIEIAKKRRAK